MMAIGYQAQRRDQMRLMSLLVHHIQSGQLKRPKSPDAIFKMWTKKAPEAPASLEEKIEELKRRGAKRSVEDQLEELASQRFRQRVEAARRRKA